MSKFDELIDVALVQLASIAELGVFARTPDRPDDLRSGKDFTHGRGVIESYREKAGANFAGGLSKARMPV